MSIEEEEGKKRSLLAAALKLTNNECALNQAALQVRDSIVTQGRVPFTTLLLLLCSAPMLQKKKQLDNMRTLGKAFAAYIHLMYFISAMFHITTA